MVALLVGDGGRDVEGLVEDLRGVWSFASLRRIGGSQQWSVLFEL